MGRKRLVLALSLAVSIAVAVPLLAGAAGKVPKTSFRLFVNTPFLNCLRQNATTTPTVHATVTRGRLNDKLTLSLANLKPHLAFDLFTVENSNQTAMGALTPGFRNFGLAWYQSDVHVHADGTGSATIKTILLDQIFGFDPAVSLAPTNTFHVGLWFNAPADAAACGFTGSTPFNGDHNAGPLAFITRPNATSGLGPLCTDPTGGTPPCNP